MALTKQPTGKTTSAGAGAGTTTTTAQAKRNAALACADRFMSALLDDIDHLSTLAAIDAEQTTARNFAAHCPATCQLITCDRTGQPLAYMGSHALTEYMPATIAPMWMNTGPEALATLCERQPVAALVRNLHMAVFSEDQWAAGDIETSNTVTRYTNRRSAMAALYSALAHTAPKETALIGLALVELQTYSTSATPLAGIAPALRDLTTSDTTGLTTDLITAIMQQIASLFQNTFHSVDDLASLLLLDNSALLERSEKAFRKSAARALNADASATASANAKHRAMVDEQKAVKRFAFRKPTKAEIVEAALGKVVKANFDGMLSDFFEGGISARCKPIVTPAPSQAQAQAPSPASTGFNPFAAAQALKGDQS